MLLLLMPVFPRLEPWVPARGRPDARGWLCPQASICPLGPASRLGSAVPFLGWLPPRHRLPPSPLTAHVLQSGTNCPFNSRRQPTPPFLAEPPSTAILACSVTSSIHHDQA